MVLNCSAGREMWCFWLQVNWLVNIIFNSKFKGAQTGVGQSEDVPSLA